MKHFFSQTTDVFQLMEARHSVRSYTSDAITKPQLEKLQACIDACNEESGLNIFLVTDEPKAFSNFAARYGHFTGVSNYLVLAGPDSADLEEKCGYYGEELVLLAQEIGLNTCWVALTFSKRVVRKMIPEGQKLCIVISLGKGETPGKPRKTRPATDLSNISEASPTWFKRGMKAACLAPTAINQQSFYFTLEDDGKTVSAVSKGDPCSTIDLGIVKHDFELAAGAENFTWK